MLFNYNRYHNAVFMGIANQATGKVYKQYSNVDYYFHLKRTNDSLVKANEKLYNKLRQDYALPDTANKLVVDTLKVDTVEIYRKYLYMHAKVIGNSVNLTNNYIQLSRGLLLGVTKDLGVTDENNAVAGTIIDVSNNYAVVMSLMHRQSSISAKIKKTGEESSTVWEGEPNRIVLKGIAKSVKVAKGDSIVTSGFTDRFPYGLLIGTIDEIISDKSSNSYTLKIKTAVNFYNVQFVYILNNLKKEEPDQLLKKVQKVNE